MIDDINFSSINTREKEKFILNNISYIPQDISLINELTILDNLKFSLSLINKKIDIEKTNDLFIKLNLNTLFLKKYPKELSSGEAQRIAIIRAILLDSKIILVDEPSSRIDPNLTLIIFSLLKEESKDKLVICVSHDKEEITPFIDGELTLDNGIVSYLNITSNNEKEELINKKVYKKGLFKLIFSNLKYKLSKSIGFLLSLIFSISLIIPCLNLIFNSWSQKANEYSVSSKIELGIYSETKFSEEFLNKINSTFINHYAYSYKYINSESISLRDRNYYSYRIFKYDSSVVTSFNFNLISGRYPSKANEFAISDVAIYNSLIEKSNYEDENTITDLSKINFNLSDIKKEFNELKALNENLTGLYSVNNMLYLYNKNDNFYYLFKEYFKSYATYDSLFVFDIESSYDFSNNYSLSIVLSSLEELDKYNKLKEEYREYSFLNPFELYVEYENENKEIYNKFSIFIILFFSVVFILFSLGYLFLIKKNHSNEFKSIINLGLNKGNIKLILFGESFAFSLISFIFGFSLSFLTSFLLNYFFIFLLNFNIGVLNITLNSLLISLIYILFVPLLSLIIKTKKI